MELRIMNKIVIMQGRLSQPHPNRLQAFPWSSWEMEFSYASTIGYDLIEWIFDAERYQTNPIWTTNGIGLIKKLADNSGVKVQSVCADYFMAHPFFRVPENERLHSIEVLEKLIIQSSKLGVCSILLPVLERSEIKIEAEKNELLNSLINPLKLAKSHGIKLGLETELPAKEYLDLIQRGNHHALGVYYDVGNATACGYDTAEDIHILRKYLCGIHIKDRKVGGKSVLLGQGDTDFKNFFHSLNNIEYQGQITLQTAFGKDFIEDAKNHINFIKDLLIQAKE